MTNRQQISEEVASHSLRLYRGPIEARQEWIEKSILRLELTSAGWSTEERADLWQQLGMAAQHHLSKLIPDEPPMPEEVPVYADDVIDEPPPELPAEETTKPYKFAEDF